MAGIFGFMDYNRPGKGISKDEPVKPRFLLFWELFFRKFWKLIQLNLLYIVFCLPIVTIGPATAGMTYVLRNFANEQPVFMFSDFWDAFRKNLKQSFVYSLIVVAFTIIMGFSWTFYIQNINISTLMYVPVGICALITLLFVFMAFYVFLMIVTVDLSLWGIIKNALILSIVCLKTNFITLIFSALILFTVWLFIPFSAIVVLLIIPAMIGFIICFNSYKGIGKYVIDPYIESQKNEKAEEESGASGSIFTDMQESKVNK